MTKPPLNTKKHTIRNIVVAAVTILFLLWLIGTCAGPERKNHSAATGTISSSTPTPSTSTFNTTATEAEPPPSSPLLPPPGKVMAGPESSCTTDSVSPPINLTGVTVKLGTLAGHPGTSATVRFAYTGTIPRTGTVLWSLLASDPAGKTVQLGYKTLDAERVAYFYFPFSEGRQHNMDGLADEHTSGEIGLFMPQAALDILGPTWWWTAVVNVEGKDIAFCPARP